MQTLIIERQDDVAVLRLNNGVTNAISPLLVSELSEAVRQIQSEFKGMILSGGPKFYSIGLDLPALLRLDRGAMAEFWEKFDQVVLDLYRNPLPSVAAMAGHATAGGAILAMTADYRFGTPGRKLIGLNEVNIGVPVPYLADLILRHTLGERIATEIVYRGELMEHTIGKDLGLVDEIHADDELETAALEAVRQLAGKPQPAFGIIKKNRVHAVCEIFEKYRRAKVAEMLDCWFLPAVQAMLTKAAEKF